MTTQVASAPATYPVRVAIERPERQSRITNFPLGIGLFVRYVLLIPHLFVLYFFGLLAGLLYLIASFAILFSGAYPRGLYDFVAGYLRWSANTAAYLLSLIDAYPPFSMDQQEYPVAFETDYPESSSKWLNFPVIGYMLKSILLIPSAIVLAVLSLAAFVVVFVAKFAILFSGSFPAGMHRFVGGTVRWSMRLQAYALGLSDRYPPFSLS